MQNNQNESWGWQPISNMLAYSINTAFVRLNREIGPANTLEAAQASGMPKTLGGMNDTNILNVLGTGDSRVVDQATGYNTLNSGGVFHDRHLISTVKSPYSDADQAMLQTASSMKLYTAIAALQHGKSVDTQYNGNNYLPIGAGTVSYTHLTLPTIYSV